MPFRVLVYSVVWTKTRLSRDFEALRFATDSEQESEAFDGLTGLVNKSLVNIEEKEGRSRYSFLETIRQYATEKLVEKGEASETRSRHLSYMLRFVSQEKNNDYGMDPGWLKRLDRERDNLRAALEWAVANNIEAAISLALKVGSYWSIRDYINEALLWYQTILQKSESLPGHEAERAAIGEFYQRCMDSEMLNAVT